MKEIDFTFGKDVVVFNAVGREVSRTFPLRYWLKMFCNPYSQISASLTVIDHFRNTCFVYFGANDFESESSHVSNAWSPCEPFLQTWDAELMGGLEKRFGSDYEDVNKVIDDNVTVNRLFTLFPERGHYLAALDPLGLRRPLARKQLVWPSGLLRHNF